MLSQLSAWWEKLAGAPPQGKKAITAETALQLERATGVPANFGNSSQRNYEATLARLEEERGLAPDSAWLKQFPLKALINLR